MIDYMGAKAIALTYVRAMAHIPDDEFIIVESETIVKDYGWVFFYDSKKHLETGDMDYAIGGNAPFIVQKKDGAIYILGTALLPENYVAEYEAKL